MHVGRRRSRRRSARSRHGPAWPGASSAHERAAGAQPGTGAWSTRCSSASRPVGPATRAPRRLPVGDLGGQLLVGRHVGRVGDDDGQRDPAARPAARRTSRPGPGGPGPPARPMPAGVGPGDGQRVLGDVGGPDVDQRLLGRQRQRRWRPSRCRDRPRAAGWRRWRRGGRPAGRPRRSARLDHLLGLRPGDQHPAVDEQVEVAEAPAAEHVLQRLAGAGDGPAGRRSGPGGARSPARRARSWYSAPSAPVTSSTMRRASQRRSARARCRPGRPLASVGHLAAR